MEIMWLIHFLFFTHMSQKPAKGCQVHIHFSHTLKWRIPWRIVFFEFNGADVTSQECCLSYNCPSFCDSVVLIFTRHCLTPRSQSYRILYFRCQRKERTWLWASVILPSTMPSFLIRFFSLLCFLSSLPHFFSHFFSPIYLLPLYSGHPPFLSSLLSSLSGSTPSFASPHPPSSPLISTPRSFERLLLEAVSWTQSLFYGE